MPLLYFFSCVSFDKSLFPVYWDGCSPERPETTWIYQVTKYVSTSLQNTSLPREMERDRDDPEWTVMPKKEKKKRISSSHSTIAVLSDNWQETCALGLLCDLHCTYPEMASDDCYRRAYPMIRVLFSEDPPDSFYIDQINLVYDVRCDIRNSVVTPVTNLDTCTIPLVEFPRAHAKQD